MIIKKFQEKTDKMKIAIFLVYFDWKIAIFLVYFDWKFPVPEKK